MPVNDSVGFLQIIDFRGRVTAAPKTNGVESHDTAAYAVHHHVWRNILHDSRVATHHCEMPNAAELMHGDATGDEGPVRYRDMAPQHGPIGKNHIVSEHNVMPQVTIRGKANWSSLL